MSRNCKQKSLCQLANTKIYPKQRKNRATEQKCVWV